MKHDDIVLKVQAFVDGELPETDQAEIASLIARDSDVHALVKELKQTRQALATFDETLELPESPEFYWSKIQREIGRQPRETEHASRTRSGIPLLRWLMPVTGMAVVVAAGFLLMQNRSVATDEVQWQAANDTVNAFTYRDFDEGLTVMWLSYSSDDADTGPAGAATVN